MPMYYPILGMLLSFSNLLRFLVLNVVFKVGKAVRQVLLFFRHNVHFFLFGVCMFVCVRLRVRVCVCVCVSVSECE